MNKNYVLKLMNLLVVFIFVFISISGFCPQLFSATERGKMQGELYPDLSGIVQSYNTYEEGSQHVVKMQIKLMKTGHYVVIAGFHKGNCWHKGFFSDTRYYGIADISGEKGDIINVEIRYFTPPFNRDWTIGFFKSENDICTKG